MTSTFTSTTTGVSTLVGSFLFPFAGDGEVFFGYDLILCLVFFSSILTGLGTFFPLLTDFDALLSFNGDLVALISTLA